MALLLTYGSHYSLYLSCHEQRHHLLKIEMFMGIQSPFPTGIPWEWEWAGMEINIHGNGNDTYSHGNLFPLSFQRMQATVSSEE